MNEGKLDPTALHRIGIDVGGTKIEGIVLDAGGQECERLRCATPVQEGYEPVVESIARLYESLAERVGQGKHTLGIGTPGSISPATQLLRNCNATGLNGRPLHRDLEARIGRPFAMANDANCFALAESRMGAAAQSQEVLGIVLGTGVGAGLVVHGRLVEGRNGIAGEWGHMVLDPQGPACYCGRRGCVERYLSGPALEQAYRQATGTDMDAARIVDRARAGEGAAAAVFDRFLDRFAEALANVVAVLDPQAIVIGGGLASIDELYTEGVRRLLERVFCDAYTTPVLRNRLGNAAGVFGAAMVGI
ncbi:ROK family protein [Acidovorax sp. NCPPB 4044]|uniref:ROK family protein n=1 Tax=Acidovorax sp. NCPPB 4044 TaxID=2940490 RepID=UPI002303E8E6|nr:ROK family protein [Acidovorax sp. NCPPB 4044]MDA8520658.1 ROK family protein [Acidovorax sp. NCPPB 4044]